MMIYIRILPKWPKRYVYVCVGKHVYVWVHVYVCIVCMKQFYGSSVHLQPVCELSSFSLWFTQVSLWRLIAMCVYWLPKSLISWNILQILFRYFMWVISSSCLTCWCINMFMLCYYWGSKCPSYICPRFNVLIGTDMGFPINLNFKLI